MQRRRHLPSGSLIVSSYILLVVLTGSSIAKGTPRQQPDIQAQHRQASSTVPLTLQKIDSGYNQPLFLTHAPGDSTRLFVLEKGGLAWIINNGSRLSRPFLDVRDRMLETGEGGLLCLVFAEDYLSSGTLYVSYTGLNGGEVVVSRLQVSADPDSVDLASEDTLLSVPHHSGRHVGGMMAINPNDGFLSISIGDGGAGDPGNRAQNLDSLLGKILRIDISTPSGYAIPPDNPFAGSIPGRDEIWALGLRNMWRFSFDRLTGDFWGGDVGHGTSEELDYEAAGAPGGANYGWKLKEGYLCNEPPVNCDSGLILTDPITTYGHGENCAITGGYVYRGCAVQSLQGAYFYGDLCSGQVWSIRWNGTSVYDSISWGSQLEHTPFTLVSFGEDAAGELYTVEYDGDIFKIVPD